MIANRRLSGRRTYFGAKMKNDVSRGVDEERYLGARMRNFTQKSLNTYLDIQIKKANSAFHANNRIFYNKFNGYRRIDPKIKLICYMLKNRVNAPVVGHLRLVVGHFCRNLLKSKIFLY